MPVAHHESHVRADSQLELSDVHVVGKGDEGSPEAYIPPPQYSARRGELVGPVLLLSALVLFIAGAVTLVIPWERLGTPESSTTNLLREALPPAPPAAVGTPEEANTEAHASAELVIETHPAGATVSVDDAEVGEAPVGALSVAGGYRWITVSHPDFPTLDTLVFATAGQRHQISLRLMPAALPEPAPATSLPSERMGEPSASSPPLAPPQTPRPASSTLTVAVSPAQAVIRIDGVAAGDGRARLENLPPGTYTVVASAEGFHDVARSVRVVEGESRVVHLELPPVRPALGTLAVTVRPWGSIYIDGQLEARDTDLRVTAAAPAGSRSVRAVHPQLGSREVRAEVRPGETTSILIDLLK